jgi:CRP-like cAMP-binding protein
MTAEGQDFPVERLGRGCSVNHRSFLLNDENDCNARCKTVVSAFVLPFNDIDNIRFKSDELDTNIKKIEHEMLGLKNAIAIDYIIQHPPHKRIERVY